MRAVAVSPQKVHRSITHELLVDHARPQELHALKRRKSRFVRSNMCINLYIDNISANADGPRDAASGSRDVTTPLSGMVRRPQAGTNYTINLIPREAVVLHTYSTVAGVASDRPANFTLKGVHGVNTALR